MSNPAHQDLSVVTPLPAPLARDSGHWSPEPAWENYPADTQAFSLAVEYPEAPDNLFD